MTEAKKNMSATSAPTKLPFRPKLTLAILMIPVVIFMMVIASNIIKLMTIWHDDQDMRGGGMLFPAVVSYQITILGINLILCGIFVTSILLIWKRSKYGRISARIIGILLCLLFLYALYDFLTTSKSDDVVYELMGGAFELLLAMPILWATMHSKSKDEFVGR